MERSHPPEALPPDDSRTELERKRIEQKINGLVDAGEFDDGCLIDELPELLESKPEAVAQAIRVAGILKAGITTLRVALQGLKPGAYRFLYPQVLELNDSHIIRTINPLELSEDLQVSSPAVVRLIDELDLIPVFKPKESRTGFITERDPSLVARYDLDQQAAIRTRITQVATSTDFIGYDRLSKALNISRETLADIERYLGIETFWDALPSLKAGETFIHKNEAARIITHLKEVRAKEKRRKQQAFPLNRPADK